MLISPILANGQRRQAWFRCGQCGNGILLRVDRVKSGNTRSCGCVGKHGHARAGRCHPEYGLWQSMRTRCNNPKVRAYSYYGGRGIRVCDRWDDFTAFLADMGPRPKGATLDRIDPDGPYAPDNCRWATIKEQRLNQKRVVRYSYRGESLSMSELSEKYGVNFWLLRSRLEVGQWTIEQAMETE